MSEHDENSALEGIDKMLAETEGESQPSRRRRARPANVEAAPAAPEPEEERLHEFLSNDEVAQARARARLRVEEQRRKAALKRIEEEEIERLKVEEGFTTGDRVKDEIVNITIDLAPHSDKIVINGRAYWHGFSYDVPRHVADSMREIMARGWGHQDEIDGKNRAQAYAQNRQFALLKKGKAAPTTVMSAASGHVSGVKPANLGLRAGPEDHAHG